VLDCEKLITNIDRKKLIMKKPKLIHIIALIISAFCICTKSANAQNQVDEIYGSANGDIQIVGVLNDTTLIAESNQLVMVLNFDTGEFLLVLDISSLHTGNDSLDKILKKLGEDKLEYKGNLGVDFIKTVDHSPKDFDVGGYLTHASENRYLAGKGHLEYLYGDVKIGVLRLIFKLKLAEMNIHLGIEGLEDEIQIEISQTVIKS